jgi:hypothetical protein
MRSGFRVLCSGFFACELVSFIPLDRRVPLKIQFCYEADNVHSHIELE